MRRFIKKIPAGLTSAIVTVLVLYFSLSAHPIGAEKIMWFKGADKMWHFIMYFVLTCIYYMDYIKYKYPHHTKLNGEALAVAFAIVLGGVLEVLQGLSGKRTMDSADFWANTAGAIAAFLFVKFYFMSVFRRYLKPRHHHHSHSSGENG